MLELQWRLFGLIIGIAGYCMIVEFQRRGYFIVGVILYVLMVYLLFTVANNLSDCSNL